MSSLPKGWATAAVGQLFKISSGGTPDKGNSSYWGGDIPWLSSGDIKTYQISNSAESITRKGLEGSSARLCRVGSLLLVVRSGILKHTLPVAILEIEAAINQDIKCLDSGIDELNLWLALALRAASNDILAQNREGTTVQSVKTETLTSFQLLIPPPVEQRRIVAKVDEIVALSSLCHQRLQEIPTLLARFRQSVFASAYSGRLTADWRTKHNDVKNIDAVVRGIRRQRELEARTTAQAEKVMRVFDAVEVNDPTELPNTWRFVSLHKLVTSFDYGTSSKSAKSGAVPVLRMGNIQDGKLDWTDLAYTSDRKEIKAYTLKPQTVLFNRTNSPELVGKTAIYRGERPAIFAGYLIRINPVPELDPEYLNLCLNTSEAREFCARVKTDGVSQSNINAQKLGNFEVPFCSLAEQKEIVRRVQGLLSLLDRLNDRYEKARVYVERLTQATLAKAFRGELVPLEVDLAAREGRGFESGEELLERIQRDHASKSDPSKVDTRRGGRQP